MEFLLNNQPIEFGAEHLPMFISGQDKSGASFFSVSVVSQFFLRGEKILFFSLKQPAVDKLKEQCAEKSKDIFCLEDARDLARASEYPAVVVKSGDSSLCVEAIRELSDADERIIFIKNFEETLNPVLWDLLVDNNKVILSGDIDLSRLMPEIVRKKYSAKILFSRPDVGLGINVPELPKYSGYLKSGTKEGIVSVQA